MKAIGLQIREDLYGWYVLDADIDLSGIADWNPIGSYESDYEMADGEWWKKAFKGRLDGQGHKISGLHLTTDTPTMKALFGAVANGEICNLTIENCRIDLKSSSVYAAPLIAVMKQDGGRQAIVQNVEVKNVQVKVHETVSESVFSSVLNPQRSKIVTVRIHTVDNIFWLRFIIIPLLVIDSLLWY